MSYLFDAEGEYLRGAFSSTYGYPFTLGCWVRRVNWNTSSNYKIALSFGIAADFSESHTLSRKVGGNTDFSAASIGSTNTYTFAEYDWTGATYDDVWIPVIGVFVSDTERRIYFGDLTNTNTSTINRPVTETLDEIAVGNSLEVALDQYFFNGKVAEVGIWQGEFSDSQIQDFFDGKKPSFLPGCIGYWPLDASSGTHANLGSDAGGTLTVTNATFDSDHPNVWAGFKRIKSNSARVAGYNPIHKVGDNYYYIVIDTADPEFGTSGRAACYKATSITGAWVEQDAGKKTCAQQIDPATGRRCQYTFLDSNNIIHVANISNSGAYVTYSQFQTSTDTWVVLEESSDPETTFFLTEWNPVDADWISITERGNGDLILFAQGTTEAVMGDAKWRVDYMRSTDGGDTWGAVTAVDDGGDIHYGNPIQASGSQSTDTHFLYQRQTDVANDPPIAWADLQGKTLSTTTLSTVVTTAGASTTGQLRGFTNAISFNTGSVQRVVLGGANSSFIIERSRSDEDGNNDLSTPVNETGGNVPAIKLANEASHICVIGPNPSGDIHWVYSSGTDNDVFYLTSTDDGNNLVSNNAIELFNGVTANWPSASYVDGYGFLVVWEDGSGNTVYDFNNAFSENDVLSPTSFVTGLAGAGTALTITNVNTTDEWDDGDTNIPATGTGFYTVP